MSRLGTIPLSSVKMISFLNKLPGITIPSDISDLISNAKDPVEKSVELTLELIDEIKSQNLGGVHIMPVGRMNVLEKIMQQM